MPYVYPSDVAPTVEPAPMFAASIVAKSVAGVAAGTFGNVTADLAGNFDA